MIKVNYIVKNEKRANILSTKVIIEGFLLPSKTKKFLIDGQKITNIMIINKKLASPFVTKIVLKKYQKLIKKLTDLFISEEDEGTTMNEVLNEIEKFKDEIKRKYRKYLKRKELEKMSYELKILRQEAKRKQMELYYSVGEKTSNRTR